MEIALNDRSAVIVDRHPMWVQAFSQLLSRLGLEVRAQATDLDALVGLVEEHRPDVLVLEFDIVSEQRVLADLRTVLDLQPDLKVIVVSERADPERIEVLFEEGASAYCTKVAAADDFAAAIRQSFSRSVYLAGVRHENASGADGRWRGRNRHELTRRELEILTLVAEGRSNSQVAEMLWVTEQTVKFHLSNIYRKLDVANRTEASRWAQMKGILPDKVDTPVAALS
jgi:DNA-binding NarL/FixJ family response regulator